MRATIYAMGLLSGAAALTYQVVWVRRLSLILGIGTWATATVLAVFMGGLALGSFWFGRRASRVRRPLLLFGLLELGIAGAALLLPLGWRAFEDAYPRLWQALDGAPLPLTAAAALGTALLLVIPTTLMGGTLPVLARPASRATATVAWDVGRLYAANTLGAVLGCLASGLLLLPELGLTGTVECAVAVNVVVGSAAILLGWRARHDSRAGRDGGAEAEAETVAEGEAVTEAGALSPSVVLLVAAVSGACALGYEVLWTRVLVFFLHNSTYAFTTMLACFLLGLVLGSALWARSIDRLARPGLALAACQLGVGLLTLGAALLHPTLPTVAELLAQQLVIDAWWKALVLQTLLAAGMLLPAAVCMGLSFPLAVRLVARGPTVSRDVGHLVAANTAGAIVGSLLTAFLLVPWLGLAASFRLLVALNLAAALLVALACPGISRALRRGVAAFVLLAVAALPTLLPATHFSRTLSRGQQLLYYADGASDTVMVVTHPAAPDVRVLAFGDGRGTAGTDTNAINRFYGHLPMLLHGKARQVLSICLGTGNTLAALALHPNVEHIDAVELSAQAVEAARWFPTNQGVWQDPRVELHVGDGRQWLLATDRSYDVIQLEPPEIHTAGVVHLYTREFYVLARQRLRPGGLLCHWANVRMMSLDAQRMLVATFLEVFPHGTLWMPLQSPGYLLLVAGTQPLTIDYPSLQERCTTGPVGDDLRDVVGISAATDLLASFQLGPQGARDFCGDAPVLTDDRTRVDFLVPRSRDANFGLMNAFSGLRFDITSMLPDHREYVADKLTELAAHIETAFPLLRGFPDRALRYAVRTRLEWRRERWLETFDTLITQVRSGEATAAHY